MSTLTPEQSHGYVTDVPYVYHYFTGLSPLHIKLAAAFNGVVSAPITKPFTYLELGCGNAISLCVNAALFPHAEFYGIDLMEDHITFAQKIVDKAGIKNLTLINKDFAKVKLDELPDFDFIAAHGVISWVSPEVHEEMLNIIDKKLKKGGLVYMSYNTYPGWSERAQMREVLANLTNHDLSSKDRLKTGYAILNVLHENKSPFFETHPQLKKFFEHLKKEDPSYLIHEFMHDYWQAFYCREIFTQYAQHKLQYVGSAKLQENFVDLTVPKSFHPLLQNIKSKAVRECVIDFIRNQGFRQDIFVKEYKGAKEVKVEDLYDGIDVCLLHDRKPQEEIKVMGSSYKMQGPIFDAVNKLLSTKKQSLVDIINKLIKEGNDPNNVYSFITRFFALRQAMLCNTLKEKDYDEKSIQTLNRLLLEIAVQKREATNLVSPKHGTPVGIAQNIVPILFELSKNDMDLKKMEKSIVKHVPEEQKDNLEKVLKVFKENLYPMIVKELRLI